MQSDGFRAGPDRDETISVEYERLGTTDRGWPYYRVLIPTRSGRVEIGTVTNLGGGIWESDGSYKIYRTGTTNTRHEAARELLIEGGYVHRPGARVEPEGLVSWLLHLLFDRKQ